MKTLREFINRNYTFLKKLPEAKKKQDLIKKFIKSLIYSSLGNRKQFGRITHYCMFIGHARSGSSIISSLIDAHPDACIGMEENVINLVSHGFSREQIYYLLKANSVNQRRINNNTWTNYSYCVPEQHQGIFKNIKVIGDKKADDSTKLIGHDFSVYRKLAKILKTPIKIIHVIRNPYDNISTMVMRNLVGNVKPTMQDFQRMIDHYFENVQIINTLYEMNELDIFILYHEDFITDTSKNLIRLINFLELEPSGNYIEDCAKVVYKEPHKSRYDIEWPESLIEIVQQRIDNNPFLRRYTLHS